MPFITHRERERPEPLVQQNVVIEREPELRNLTMGSMTVRELRALLARQDPDMTVFFYDARMAR